MTHKFAHGFYYFRTALSYWLDYSTLIYKIYETLFWEKKVSYHFLVELEQ